MPQNCTEDKFGEDQYGVSNHRTQKHGNWTKSSKRSPPDSTNYENNSRQTLAKIPLFYQN